MLLSDGSRSKIREYPPYYKSTVWIIIHGVSSITAVLVRQGDAEGVMPRIVGIGEMNAK
jgi:hypothetical protein